MSVSGLARVFCRLLSDGQKFDLNSTKNDKGKAVFNQGTTFYDFHSNSFLTVRFLLL
jgi:hypothetical protein